MKTVKLADTLKTCVDVGYDGVELVLLPDWPAETQRHARTTAEELGKRQRMLG